MGETMFDAVIIGGGAAGCMAAITAAERGLRVAIIERNEAIGKKLRITGKGRCNLTNNRDIKDFLRNVPRNAKFLYSALNALPPGETMSMFERFGVPLKTERGGRVFPLSDDARDIVNALAQKLSEHGVEIIRGRAVGIDVSGGGVAGIKAVTGIKREKDYISCESAVIATGGASYRATGSTGDGYKIAKNLGHTVTELMPSLAPLVSDDKVCAEVAGLSLKNVRLTAFENDAEIFTDFGELLFTHFGLSGPLVLSASAHMRNFGKSEYKISIDLKPALTLETLEARLLSDFAENRNRDFINALDALLPKKIIPAVVRKSGIEPRKKVNAVTKRERGDLLRVLKNFTVNISGTRPLNEAIITSGGVDLKEINPRTMESKLVKGLYFAGEVIDTDAYTGGFNLQIAWSTGYLAGKSV